MWAICKKELQSYFYSPIGYSFIAIFLFVTGVLFYINNIAQSSADFAAVLNSLTMAFMFTIPVITMRLMSEERRSKSDQMLLTAPIRLTSIVLGKYFAALIVYLITLVLTFVYPIILGILGTLDMAVVVAGYVGFFLIGAVMIAIGVFISSITTSQATAAVATFAAILTLYMLDSVISTVNAGWLYTALRAISVYSRYTDFTIGAIGLSPIVYFLTVIAIFIFLTIRAIERRRWSKG